MSETADLISDNERNLPRYPPSSRAASSWATSSAYSMTARSSSPDVIIISDSDDDEDKTRPTRRTRNSVVQVSHVVKEEQKRTEEIFRAVKHEPEISSILGLRSNQLEHRFALNITRDSISVTILLLTRQDTH